MKTIGLLGGMSWQSTASYYKIINELVQQRLGGLHSAKIFLYTVDFNEISELQKQGDWNTATTKLRNLRQNYREQRCRDFTALR